MSFFSPASFSSESQGPSKSLLIGIVLVLGVLLPATVFGALPLLGITMPAALFTPKMLVLATAGAGGLVFFSLYWDYLQKHPPVLLLLLMGVYLPLLVYLTGLMISVLGINIHFRLLLMIVMTLPVLIAYVKHGKEMLKDTPFLSLFLCFFFLVVFYIMFFNGASKDGNISREGSFVDGDMSFTKLINYYMALIGMTITWLAFKTAPHRAKLFDMFNTHLLWVTSVISIISLIGYPLNMFSMVLDGFHRSTGLTGHPALYSSHMGIVMTYFLGLFCYYQGPNAPRISKPLLYGGLVINFLGFVIGFSKTGLADFSFCALILLALNYGNTTVRNAYFRVGIFLLVVVVLAAIGFSAVSEQSIMEIIQKRLEDTNSLHARQSRWEMLLSNLEEDKQYLFGHGISAANSVVLAQWFNKLDGKPSTMIHNGYLELLYDFGIFGYCFLLAMLTAVAQAVRRFFTTKDKSANPLMATIIAVTVYYLIEMGFGEVMMMFDICILYWMFITMLLCVWKHHQQPQRPLKLTKRPAA